MPVLDASALDTDPEGLAFLHAVLDQGRTSRSQEPRTPESKPPRPRASAKLAPKAGPALREVKSQGLKPGAVPPRSKVAPRSLDARR